MKTLLLTGGSQGIGRAAVEYFLERDWRVVFVARNPGGIQKALDELAARGFGADVVRGLPLDAADLDAVENFPAACPFLEDGLDALVLNAFYQKIRPAHELSREELEMHWRVNNLSPILMIRACHPKLLRNKGAVVYVSSIMDERVSPGYAAYGASKAYMRTFVRQAALDFGPEGVRINTISPGCIRTEALEKAAEACGTDARAALDALRESIPHEKRWGEPSEIAAAIWFAVTGPRYFHGRDLRVDGGLA
jgi:NAD(P)-dependent dehydrogenase (short-subunit alcohol dehydrogenase family)